MRSPSHRYIAGGWSGARDTGPMPRIAERRPGAIPVTDEQQARRAAILKAAVRLGKAKEIDRTSAQEITLFDSVGFALEDFSALRYLDAHLGHGFHQSIDLIPAPADAKDLYRIALGRSTIASVPRAARANA